MAIEEIEKWNIHIEWNGTNDQIADELKKYIIFVSILTLYVSSD